MNFDERFAVSVQSCLVLCKNECNDNRSKNNKIMVKSLGKNVAKDKRINKWGGGGGGGSNAVKRPRHFLFYLVGFY